MMKRSHWLWCGAGLLALVVGLLATGISAPFALSIAALLVCPLMMLIMMMNHTHPADHDEQPSRHGEAASSEPTRSDTSAGAERSLR
jgi:Protein of unknown function (DUF2933)